MTVLPERPQRITPTCRENPGRHAGDSQLFRYVSRWAGAAIIGSMFRRRHRLHVAFVAIVCLLFQQAAVAAYACTMPAAQRTAAAMAEDCASMGMKVAQDTPALCAKHCAPDQAIAADQAASSVVPLVLAPLEFAPTFDLPRTRSAPVANAPPDRSSPPPRLRYCSLLI